MRACSTTAYDAPGTYTTSSSYFKLTANMGEKTTERERESSENGCLKTDIRNRKRSKAEISGSLRLTDIVFEVLWLLAQASAAAQFGAVSRRS